MTGDSPLFQAMIAGAEACGMILVPTKYEHVEIIHTPGAPTLVFMPVSMNPAEQGRSLSLIILDEQRRSAA